MTYSTVEPGKAVPGVKQKKKDQMITVQAGIKSQCKIFKAGDY